MKIIFITLLAFFSSEAFASKKCSLVTTIDAEKKLMIFRFTTQASSDLVQLMPLNKSCVSVMTSLISDFPRSFKFDAQEMATVFIYKHDPEDPLSTLFALTVFQQEYEVIEMADKSGIKVVPKEFSGRVKADLTPNTFSKEGCRVALSLDLNGKSVNFRLTEEVSSDLVELVHFDQSCSQLLNDFVDEHPSSVMFEEVEYANVYIYKRDPEDPLAVLFALKAHQQGFEIIETNDDSVIKVVAKEFADRVKQ